MSDRTGTKIVKLAIALTGCAVAAIPVAALLSRPALADDAAASGHAATAAPTADPARIAKGRDLFTGWSCSACHTLADAKANGAVGPSFDGDTNITEEFVTNRVTNGQGAMPSFGGQLSKEEIADLAYYLTNARTK